MCHISIYIWYAVRSSFPFVSLFCWFVSAQGKRRKLRTQYNPIQAVHFSWHEMTWQLCFASKIYKRETLQSNLMSMCVRIREAEGKRGRGRVRLIVVWSAVDFYAISIMHHLNQSNYWHICLPVLIPFFALQTFLRQLFFPISQDLRPQTFPFSIVSSASGSKLLHKSHKIARQMQLLCYLCTDDSLLTPLSIGKPNRRFHKSSLILQILFKFVTFQWIQFFFSFYLNNSLCFQSN